MSQDQKPRPVKAVTIAGGGAAEGAEAGTPEGAEGMDAAAAKEAGAASGGSRRSLLAPILFLLACVAGGAGLTVLPHLMPEMAERLYGQHP